MILGRFSHIKPLKRSNLDMSFREIAHLMPFQNTSVEEDEILNINIVNLLLEEFYRPYLDLN
jgi:hypothetical protein